MVSILGRLLIALGLVLPLGIPQFSQAEADSLPGRPPTYVLDEIGALNEGSRSALYALLAEHERLTGEEIFVAILKQRDGAQADIPRELFLNWQIGRASRGSGVLVAVFPKSGRGEIQVGYGLEGVLGAESDRIEKSLLVPAVRRGKTRQAIGQTLIEILRVLESPLVSSPQAEAALYALSKDTKHPNDSEQADRAWWLLLLLGLALAGSASFFAVSHEAHYTSAGWFRPRPWQLLRRGKGEKPQLQGACGGW